MADRESFPYGEDWRRDVPELMRIGIMPTVATAIVERFPSDSERIREVLHARAIWCEWDYSDDGERFLSIQYKYPSAIYGENEMGNFALNDGPLQTDDPELLAIVKGMADTRTVEIHRLFDGDSEFVPAVSL